MLQRYINRRIALFLFVCIMASVNLGRAEQQSDIVPQDPPLWTPEDVVTLPTLSITGISSDGQYTLMEVSYTSIKEDNPTEFTQCVLVNNDSLEKRVLGDQKRTCIQSSFVGAGEKFTYILYDKQAKAPVLFIEDILSPQRKKIKVLPHNFVDYSFAPDGKSFAFMTKEVTKPSPRTLEGEEKDPKRSLYLQKVNAHFQCVGKPKRLISSELNLADSGKTASYLWSPNSQTMALIIKKPDWKLPHSQVISILDINKGTLETIEEGETNYLSLTFSPDSQHLAFIKGLDLGDEVDPIKPFKTLIQSTVQIVDLKTKKREAILAEDLWSIKGWTHDGKKLIGTKQEGTKQKIYEYDIQFKTLNFKNTPNISVAYGVVLSQNHRYIGFLGETFSHPAEAYVSSLKDFKPKKISTINENIDLSQIEAKSLTWKSFDGLEIEGILVYPQNYRAGEKVPLIVSVHGGPAGAESEYFIGSRWFGYSPAVFSSVGYATLVVNYRGSMGYGTKFSKLSYQNLGKGDFQDIMTGVDFLIKEGIADPKQLFIAGHSYGGFMTAWAIGHTDRFKAAVVKAGISDWISDIALTDAPQLMESLFGSFYWDDYPLYRKSSPLSYVNDIKTPTLIFHGLYDKRVTFSQAQQLYQALKAKKVPTQLFLYIDQDHSISSPLAVIDSLKEQLKWFEKYK